MIVSRIFKHNMFEVQHRISCGSLVLRKLFLKHFRSPRFFRWRNSCNKNVRLLFVCKWIPENCVAGCDVGCPEYEGQSS